ARARWRVLCRAIPHPAGSNIGVHPRLSRTKQFSGWAAGGGPLRADLDRAFAGIARTDGDARSLGHLPREGHSPAVGRYADVPSPAVACAAAYEPFDGDRRSWA